MNKLYDSQLSTITTCLFSYVCTLDLSFCYSKSLKIPHHVAALLFNLSWHLAWFSCIFIYNNKIIFCIILLNFGYGFCTIACHQNKCFVFNWFHLYDLKGMSRKLALYSRHNFIEGIKRHISSFSPISRVALLRHTGNKLQIHY